jgi:hypothetical protein
VIQVAKNLFPLANGFRYRCSILVNDYLLISGGSNIMRSNAALADRFAEEATVELRNNQGFKGVFAKERVERHSVIFYLRGTITARPTKYTIQLGKNRHLKFPAIRKGNNDLNYSWQYLNHNCEPNSYINTADRTLRALREIAAGEEINFNYLTTEAELAVPFTCNCGSVNCFGVIRGYDFLTAEEAERLRVSQLLIQDTSSHQTR